MTETHATVLAVFAVWAVARTPDHDDVPFGEAACGAGPLDGSPHVDAGAVEWPSGQPVRLPSCRFCALLLDEAMENACAD